jgi:hypothetical protein
MWIDDFVKKGIDKSLTFVKNVTDKREPTVTSPPRAPTGLYVLYSLRDAQDTVDLTNFPERVEADICMYLSKGSSVGDVIDSFPIRDGSSYIFRFKAEDEEFGYVWRDEWEREVSCPEFNGQVCVEVVRVPVRSTRKPEVTTSRYTAPPNREELVKQRLEKEAAQVQAARDFAQASAKSESDRRQGKLDVQSAVGPELDKWAFTDGEKFKDVRSLLSSMESVLWLNSGWETVALAELMISDATVKKLYRKAILLCHPDKHQKASPEQQYRADRIFSAINESYKCYNHK